MLRKTDFSPGSTLEITVIKTVSVIEIAVQMLPLKHFWNKRKNVEHRIRLKSETQLSAL